MLNQQQIESLVDKVETLETRIELLEKMVSSTKTDQQREYSRREANQKRYLAESLGMKKC
jgi:hypothetical protein